MRAGVVLGVSRLPVELDPRHHRVRRGVDNKVPPLRFVRDEDSPLLWSVRDPVREPRPGDARHDPEGGIVHNDDRVIAGRGGIGAVLDWHRQDASHRGKPVEIRDDASSAYVDNDKLPGDQRASTGGPASVQRGVGNCGIAASTNAVSVRVSISHPPYGVRRCTTLTTNAPLSGRASARVSGKRNRASGSVVYPEFHTTNTSSPITGIQWNRRLKSTRSLALSYCTNASRLARVSKSYSSRFADTIAVNAPAGSCAPVRIRSVLTMTCFVTKAQAGVGTRCGFHE